jgi:hypothetical protein
VWSFLEATVRFVAYGTTEVCCSREDVTLNEAGLKSFAEHLQRTAGLKTKVAQWHVRWVRDFSRFSEARGLSPWEDATLDAFVSEKEQELEE